MGRRRKAVWAHRSHHHPRNVARTHLRVRRGRAANHQRREKNVRLALSRSNLGNRSSTSIGTPSFSSPSFHQSRESFLTTMSCFGVFPFLFGCLGESRTTCVHWCSQRCGLRPQRSEKKGKQRPRRKNLPTKPDNLQKRHPPLLTPTRGTHRHRRYRAQPHATTMTIGQKSSRRRPAPRHAA